MHIVLHDPYLKVRTVFIDEKTKEGIAEFKQILLNSISIIWYIKVDNLIIPKDVITKRLTMLKELASE